MKEVTRWTLSLAVVLAAVSLSHADDVTGAGELLCAPMTANACWLESGCEQRSPVDTNVPMFIEVDLDAKILRTTKASGENRTTEIKTVIRDEGLIVLQGYQKRRAFSFVITEETGVATFSVAGDDEGAVIFGACTPKP